MTQRYPLPITPAMLAVANPYAGFPRYMFPADWQGGIVGNDVDIATTTLATAGSSGAAQGGTPVYGPRTQNDKLAGLGTTLAADIGIDYGEYAGEAGRTGTIEPGQRYPDKSDVVIP